MFVEMYLGCLDLTGLTVDFVCDKMVTHIFLEESRLHFSTPSEPFTPF